MKAKIAVMTVCGKDYYLIVNELKRRNMPFLSLRPCDAVPIEIRVAITTEKEKADFVIEVTPAGFKQSKNVVTVTSRAGDVVHAGAAFNLGNAVKDACAAILERQ
jgi:hypothetical protein